MTGPYYVPGPSVAAASTSTSTGSWVCPCASPLPPFTFAFHEPRTSPYHSALSHCSPSPPSKQSQPPRMWKRGLYPASLSQHAEFCSILCPSLGAQLDPSNLELCLSAFSYPVYSWFSIVLTTSPPGTLTHEPRLKHHVLLDPTTISNIALTSVPCFRP